MKSLQQFLSPIEKYFYMPLPLQNNFLKLEVKLRLGRKALTCKIWNAFQEPIKLQSTFTFDV